MANDEIKGKVENLKGRVKEAAGSLSGDKKLQAEGTFDRMKGAAQEKVGEVKRKVSNKIDEANQKDEDEDDDL